MCPFYLITWMFSHNLVTVLPHGFVDLIFQLWQILMWWTVEFPFQYLPNEPFVKLPLITCITFIKMKYDNFTVCHKITVTASNFTAWLFVKINSETKKHHVRKSLLLITVERTLMSSEDRYRRRWVASLLPAPLLSVGTLRFQVYLPARQKETGI